MSKVIQIATTSVDIKSAHCNLYIVALDEDGVMWRCDDLHPEWIKVYPPAPKGDSK